MISFKLTRKIQCMTFTLLSGLSSLAHFWNVEPNFASAFGLVRPLVRLNTATRLSRFTNEFPTNASFDSNPTQSSFINTNHGSSSPQPKYSFEAMTRFDDRLSILEEEAPTFLTDYFQKDIYSFSINPGKEQQRLSVSSTVYGLQALSEYPSTDLARFVGIPGPRIRNIEIDGNDTDGPLKNQIRALIHSEWRENDLYDISLMLSIILELDPSLQVVRALVLEDQGSSGDVEKNTAEKFATMLEKVLSGRPRRRHGEVQVFSAYISYVCATVYVKLAEVMNRDPANQSLRLGVLNVQTRGLKLKNPSENCACPPIVELEDSEFFFREITVAVSRSAEIARDELCRQLAYRSAGDAGSFDVIKLTYNLLTYVTATESLKGNTLLSTAAATKLMNGDGEINDDTDEDTSNLFTVTEAAPKLNRRLVSSALRVFFEEQDLSDGLWDRGQPIYKSFKRGGRNVGNAYVFGIDILASLLDVLGSSSDGNVSGASAEVFRPYLLNLERALDWIERNMDVDTTVIAEECNVDTGRCFGRALRGWSSPHLSPSTGPNAWATAQTVICLARMRRIVRDLMHNDVLEEFGGVSISSRNVDRNAAWDRLLDSDLGGGAPDCRTIKSVLEERVVIPFIDAVRVDDPGVGAAYSTILFGSPGTAKTTITEAVAEKMGWDFVVIDTTAFLADGLTNVASRIRYVFSRLQALRRCVILFDEIEEFCLDRETPGISMESRMLTTAMLTAINDLRRTKQSVFFLATNRLRAFDAAIIRPGRFDMQLFVGTPNLEARVILLRQALSSIGSSETARGQSKLVLSSSESSYDDGEDPTEKIITTYREFLKSVWTQDAMFMNYLEGKQFASRVASMAETSRRVGSEVVLDEGELARVLGQQAAVMTARGPVREEYEAQMGLSRL